jgi:arylsulfatase
VRFSITDAGLTCGEDAGSSVTRQYRPPFPFTGTLHRVELASRAPGARVDRRTETQVAFAAD